MSDKKFGLYMADQPIAGRIYSLIAVGVGITLAAWLFRYAPPSPSVNWVLFVLLVAFVEFQPVTLPKGGVVSVGFATDFAAILLFSPRDAAFIAAAGFLPAVASRHPVLLDVLYAGSERLITVGISGLVYHLLGGPAGPGELVLPADILPLAAGVIVFFMLNAGLSTLGIALDTGESFRSVWKENIRWGMVTYLGVASYGIVIAFIYAEALGVFGVALVLVPLFIARYAFKQYTLIRELHLETIHALAAALEVKDSYTMGHSERVADYARAVAESLRLPEDQVERVAMAGLLHDIGKIGIKEAILNKAEQLTSTEFSDIRSHPVKGADMLSRVEFLREISDVVRYHHEWYDGSGYPEGRSGEDIPLLARIMAVADAYDAMTSDRIYRPAMSPAGAAEQLGANKGRQFDPRVVEAFLRHVWPRLQKAGKEAAASKED